MKSNERSEESKYSPLAWVRRMYDWTLGLSDRAYAGWALFSLAFIEASFFPVPPDVLLMALAIGRPQRAFWFASLCSLGSVLGAVFGYILGQYFFELVGQPIVNMYAAIEQYEIVQGLFQDWDAMAIAVAGFTPIPFKIFTIAAGAFKVDFTTFLIAALFSRSARFFLLSFLIFRFGLAIKPKIDKYFNELTILCVVLVISGFLFLKFIL